MMNASFQNFIAALQHDLQQPLPGRTAQYNMAPQPRPGAELDDVPHPNARQSSVLILFYPYAETVYFPLILRPTYPGVHSGQVGLPGGGFEPGDADLTHTALREAQEEVGIDPAQVSILGQLSTLYVRPSNNLVLPVVGWVGERPTFLPDANEVALLIEASVLEFLDPANRRTEVWQLQNRTATVPLFGIQNQTVWGATAMILGELFALPALRQLPGPVQA
jgi:8-oxo-dGTP pyrophosphatase MutT (NUDIX family)